MFISFYPEETYYSYYVILSYFARIKSPFSKRPNLVCDFIILDCQKLILRSKAFIIAFCTSNLRFKNDEGMHAVYGDIVLITIAYIEKG